MSSHQPARPAAPETRQVQQARPRCARCRMPGMQCWCAHVHPVRCKTRFLILQHDHEARRTVSTGRMALLSVPGTVLRVGLDFSGDTIVNAMLQDPKYCPLLLSPGEGAQDLASVASTLRSHAEDILLVILDGTWAQARRMRRLSRNLHALPRVVFTPRAVSEFAVRRQPAAHCASTLETIAESLHILEGPDPARDELLLAPMRVMVARQIQYGDPR